jgi:hypothetical protein
MAGGENTIAWSTNREHFVCLELLILLVMESCKHTISICMVLRSDGGGERGKKPSNRCCWSCTRSRALAELARESRVKESSHRDTVSMRQQSGGVRKAANCVRSAPNFMMEHGSSPHWACMASRSQGGKSIDKVICGKSINMSFGFSSLTEANMCKCIIFF